MEAESEEESEEVVSAGLVRAGSYWLPAGTPTPQPHQVPCHLAKFPATSTISAQPPFHELPACLSASLQYVPKSTRKRAKPSGGKPSAEEPAGEPMECEEAPVGEEEGKVKDPAAGIPAEELKADVEAVLGVIPQEELGTVSAKSLLEALADKHGFSFKSRKAEVKQWAQEFVLAKMEGAGGAAEGEAAEGAAVDETAQPEADGEQATGEAEGGGDEGGEAAAEEGEDSRESGQWLTD